MNYYFIYLKIKFLSVILDNLNKLYIKIRYFILLSNLINSLSDLNRNSIFYRYNFNLNRKNVVVVCQIYIIFPNDVINYTLSTLYSIQ